MKIQSFLIDRAVRYIKEHSNGRRPAFFGYVPEVYEAFVSAGYKPEKIFSLRANQDPEFFTRRDLLKNRAESFYVIVPDFYPGTQEVLSSYGFTKERDFVFYREHMTYSGNNKLIDEFENEIDITGNVCCNINGGVRNKIHIKCTGGALTIDITGSDNISEISGCRFPGDKNRIYMGERCGLTIEKNCRFTDTFFRMWEDSVITIDEKTTGEQGLQIIADPSACVTVGRDSMFSEQVLVTSGDGHTIIDCETGKPVNIDELGNTGSVIIGNHVWVGRRATVLGGIKGTELGDGMIIGAGSVVKGKFPNNVAVGGNPARIIRKNVAWSRNFLNCRGLEDCGGYARMTED